MEKVMLYCIKDCQIVFEGTEVKDFKEGQKHLFKERVALSLLMSQDQCWVTEEAYKNRQAYLSEIATKRYNNKKASTSKSKSTGDEKPALAPLPPDTV